MSLIKKLNRNAFNEKVLHRYLFERYYFSNKFLRNRLLPERYHKEDINLVVPEKNSAGGSYRADLSIYFKNREAGLPVEVKWSTKDFNKPNQIEYLKDKNGFLIAFDKLKTNTFKGIDYINIDPQDFSKWIATNISKLSREMLIYQGKIKDHSFSNQFWVVFLRGTAHSNFRNMLKKAGNNTFWAFKQNAHALKNIFDIQQGDNCLFILGYTTEGMGGI